MLSRQTQSVGHSVYVCFVNIFKSTVYYIILFVLKVHMEGACEVDRYDINYRELLQQMSIV